MFTKQADVLVLSKVPDHTVFDKLPVLHDTCDVNHEGEQAQWDVVGCAGNLHSLRALLQYVAGVSVWYRPEAYRNRDENMKSVLHFLESRKS